MRVAETGASTRAPAQIKALAGFQGAETWEGGFRSTRARGKAGLFPELLPVPDAGSFVEDAVAELVGQHQNLTAMMRLVREHVSEHGPSGGPRLRPTAAGALSTAAIRSGRKTIRPPPPALRAPSPA